MAAAEHSTRVARARRLLNEAEAAAGLRTRMPPRPRLVPLPGPTTAADVATASDMAEENVAVPAALAPLFPHVGLRRGAAVQVTGSTSVLLRLAEAAAGDTGWVALAALPDVGVPAAAEAGLTLSRLVTVPSPQPAAPAVLGALVDGFDVLVVGRCAELREGERRTLNARLRSRGAVLLSTEPWPGSDLTLHAETEAAEGLGEGWGALRGQYLLLRTQGRFIGGVRQLRTWLDTEGLHPEPQMVDNAPRLQAVS